MRLGVACLGIVAMLATSGCSSSDPQPDAMVTAPVSKSAVPSPPTPTADTASPSPSPSPSAATTDEPGDSPDTSAPAPVPSLPAVASLTRATIDPNTGDLLLGGFVDGIFEDGGDCIYTITGSAGGAPLSVQTTGVANVDTTSCGSTYIPRDQLRVGTYTVVLTYQNDRGATTSDPMTVKVNS